MSGRGSGRSNGRVTQAGYGNGRAAFNGVTVAQAIADRIGDDTDTFDALAALFLGDIAAAAETADGGPSPAAPGPLPRHARESAKHQHSEAAPVELLMLGHLPAMASIWGTQYIRNLAKERGGTVASVRLQAGYASVELFGDDDALVEDFATLDEAIEAASARAEAWVLRADAGEEMDLIDPAVVGSITLLTGADEAATIGAYRSIKQLAGKLHGQTGTPPSLRVVVMCTDPELADQVGSKLAATARACLSRHVDHASAPARIGSTRAASLLFNGRTDCRASGVLLRVTSALKSGPTRRASAKLHSGVAASARTAIMPLGMPVAPRGAATLEQVEVKRSVDSASDRVAGVPVPSASSGVPHTSGAMMSATSARGVPTQTGAPDQLCEHVPGLRSLSLVCPYARVVQFAGDGEGRLHVLGRFEAEELNESALGVLMIASEWAEAHATLIHAAGTSLSGGEVAAPIDASARPIMHVFTSEPRKVRRLLETDVRVHLLTRVSVGAEAAWFSTPLN